MERTPPRPSFAVSRTMSRSRSPRQSAMRGDVLRQEEMKYQSIRTQTKMEEREEMTMKRTRESRNEQRRQILEAAERRKRVMDRHWTQTRKRNQHMWQKVLDEEEAREEAAHQEQLRRLAQRRFQATVNQTEAQMIQQEKAKIHNLRMKRRVLAMEREESKFLKKMDATVQAQKRIEEAERRRQERLREKSMRTREDIDFRMTNHELNMRRVQRAHQRKVEALQLNIELYNQKTSANENLKKVIREQANELATSQRDTETMMKEMFREAEARRYREITGAVPVLLKRRNSADEHDDAIRKILAAQSPATQRPQTADGRMTDFNGRRLDRSQLRGVEGELFDPYYDSDEDSMNSSAVSANALAKMQSMARGGAPAYGNDGINAETFQRVQAMARAGAPPQMSGVDYRRDSFGSEISSPPSSLF